MSPVESQMFGMVGMVCAIVMAIVVVLVMGWARDQRRHRNARDLWRKREIESLQRLVESQRRSIESRGRLLQTFGVDLDSGLIGRQSPAELLGLPDLDDPAAVKAWLDAG